MSQLQTVSIIIPVYNEENTLEEIIRRVEESSLPYKKEIICVDDGSTDRTPDILKTHHERVRAIRLAKNAGKGAAVRAGLQAATGEAVIIQDADLEYDPADHAELIRPIAQGNADVVFGSRFVTVHPHRVLYFSHYVANKFLTFISNLCTGLNVSDMETGAKVFNRKAVTYLLPKLKARRFGIEPELVALVAKAGLVVYEVGISYHGRTYAQGKKITWRDGVAAVWHIIRANLLTS